MGEMAEMMLDGTLCQACGDFIESPSAGVPRDCAQCGAERQRQQRARDRAAKRKAPAAQPMSREEMKHHEREEAIDRAGGKTWEEVEKP